jgi:hypothetical protein
MDITVFYAWQSDRPGKLNHHLIRDAVQEACDRISADAENDWKVTLDSDTQGTPGMCDIPNTILEKIRKCDIFLADLTLVGKTDSQPPQALPNVNVVFELGYAARHLGFKALVGVVNEAFGKVEGQVFDIKRRACLKFSAEPSASKPDLKSVADKLSKELERIIRATIQAVVIPKRERAAAKAIDPKEEEQRALARARQEEHVAGLRKSLAQEFAGLVKEYLVSNDGGTESNRRAPSYYECVIQPSSAPDGPVIGSLAECRSVLTHSRVGPSTSPLPDVLHSAIATGQDWIGGRLNNYGLECWRLSQEAVFSMILSTREASMPPAAPPSISLDDMLFRLTQFFRFAARLAEKTTSDGKVDVAVKLGDIGARPLLIEGWFGRFQYSTSENELSHSWQCSREELTAPDKLAVKAACWFCERFNWESASEESLTKVQGRILQQM